MHQLQTSFSSPIGFLSLQFNNQKICKIETFQDSKSTLLGSQEDSCLVEAKRQILAYLKGIRREFRLPFDIPGQGLKKRIYETVLLIPYGATSSYSLIAEKVGIQNGARIVGLAMAENPLPLLIPCHRVILKSGSAGGYLLGGSSVKKYLLSMEANYDKKEIL